MSTRLKIAIACTVPLLVVAPVVSADEADVVNLNAAMTVMHDDNLFRLAPTVNPAAFGLQGRSDTLTITSLGVNLNKTLGRQQLIGNINAVDTAYRRNSYLDYLALNYDAKWLWAVGNRWTGEVAADRTEALNTFTDYTTTNYRQRNVRVIENERVSANYWFHTSWAALVGVTRTSVQNEQTFLAEGDYEANGYNAGMRYRPATGNTLTMRAKQMDGKYANRQFNTVSQFDNGFSQNGYELDASWLLTGKTQLRSRVEYIDRKHNHFAARDYSGWIGNLDLVHAVTVKSSLTFGYKRGLDAFQQQTTSYYESDELNLSGRWNATEKISANARVGYGARSYRGEIAPLVGEQREDKFTRAGVDLGYKPLRWVELKAGLNYEKRNVNYDNYDYKDRTGFVSVNAQY